MKEGEFISDVLITNEQKDGWSSLTILDSSQQDGPLYLLYKMTSSDPAVGMSMPITTVSFTYGGAPCLNPEALNVEDDYEKSLYPLEHDSYFEYRCDDDELDSNFRPILTQSLARLNEYNLQTSSGVYKTLTDLPIYEKMVPDAQKKKEELVYSLWQRNTV